MGQRDQPATTAPHPFPCGDQKRRSKKRKGEAPVRGVDHMEKQKALYLYISTRILIDAGETELAEELYDQAEEIPD